MWSSPVPHPTTSGPYVEINTRPESHPGLRTQGSLGEAARACRACRLLPSIRVGLGWEEVKEGWKERGLDRKEPGPTPLSPAPLREAQYRAGCFSGKQKDGLEVPRLRERREGKGPVGREECG